jgi:hypothetical protein
LVLSSDRIELIHGESVKTSISPRDKQEVLSSLKAGCPDAEYEENINNKKRWEMVDGRLVPPPE